LSCQQSIHSRAQVKRSFYKAATEEVTSLSSSVAYPDLCYSCTLYLLPEKPKSAIKLRPMGQTIIYSTLSHISATHDWHPAVLSWDFPLRTYRGFNPAREYLCQ